MKTKLAIKNALLRMTPASVPGHSVDGDEVRVMIHFTMRRQTAQAKKEAETARRSGLDMRTFTGHLDRVFFTAADRLCFTMLAKERVNRRTARYCYRTFNVDSGQVKTLQLIAPRRA